MEWHAGSALFQTVFTLLFVHELDGTNPDFIPRDWTYKGDLHRPRELITVVLRAFVFGLLKCCDLAWRNMSNGALHDVCCLLNLTIYLHTKKIVTV
jgi:hypothetical protein